MLIIFQEVIMSPHLEKHIIIDTLVYGQSILSDLSLEVWQNKQISLNKLSLNSTFEL